MPYWKIDLAWVAGLMDLLPCRTFCECAIGPMDISVAPGFVHQAKQLILIEPHPGLAATARKELGVPILEAAIGFQTGTQKLIVNNGSSFLEGTWSPTYSTNNGQEVSVVTFDAIDDGTIDVLALDCEGMEWAVLSKMRSRPKLLTIEIWADNPYKQEIFKWLYENHYTLRFTTGPTTETHLYTCTF